MLPQEMHTGIVHVRNTEALLGWTRNTFYSGITTALFWVIITHLEIGALAFAITCFGGVFISIIWCLSAYRTRLMMNHWNKSLANLERVKTTFGHGRVFSAPEFDSLENRRARNHYALLALVIAAGISWLILGTASTILTAMHHFEKFRRIIEWLFRIR